MNKEIKIQNNKTKKIILMIPSLIFVLLGIWFVFFPTEIEIKIIGFISISFGGFGIYMVSKNILSHKHPLKISQEGIYYNSYGMKTGLIKWENIEKIELRKVWNRKYIKVVVNNPDEYIKRQKNNRIQKLMESYFKSSGSPIHIYTNPLDISFDSLFNLINNVLQKEQRVINKA